MSNCYNLKSLNNIYTGCVYARKCQSHIITDINFNIKDICKLVFTLVKSNQAKPETGVSYFSLLPYMSYLLTACTNAPLPVSASFSSQLISVCIMQNKTVKSQCITPLISTASMRYGGPLEINPLEDISTETPCKSAASCCLLCLDASACSTTPFGSTEE